MKCPFCIKTCTKCEKLLVAYSGNFKKTKKGKYGFVSRCKKCDKQYYEENKKEISEKHKQYYEKNKEEILEKKKQYYEGNKEEILDKNKQYREEHKEEITKQKKQYYEDNKEEILEYQKQYREEHKEELKEKKKEWCEEHKEEILEYQKQYREEHKEELKEKNKIYREEHKEELKESKKEWYKNNPHKVFNYRNKRRSKLESQGNGITKEQWYEMMCWFDWCCAYSGEYLGNNNNNRTIDHITPISKGGEHEIWNCVPMYASYNYSKHISDMEEWYKQQGYFSEERLQKIYEWQEYALNKWGNYNE